MTDFYSTYKMRSVGDYKALDARHQEQFQKPLIDQADFSLWQRFFKECCGALMTLAVLCVIGFLSLYMGVVGGYVERIPTIEEVGIRLSLEWLFGKKPETEESFNNIAANCFAGTLTPCQLSLIDPDVAARVTVAP